MKGKRDENSSWSLSSAKLHVLHNLHYFPIPCLVNESSPDSIMLIFSFCWPIIYFSWSFCLRSSPVWIRFYLANELYILLLPWNHRVMARFRCQFKEKPVFAKTRNWLRKFCDLETSFKASWMRQFLLFLCFLWENLLISAYDSMQCNHFRITITILMAGLSNTVGEWEKCRRNWNYVN